MISVFPLPSHSLEVYTKLHKYLVETFGRFKAPIYFM